MNWKSATGVVLITIVIFAIYIFADPDQRDRTTQTIAGSPTSAISTVPVEPVRTDLLEPKTGSYRSDRNLFSYEEPPPPPAPKPPPPPPDGDDDGIPDMRDNCPETANADQQDIDRDGVGTACETESEIKPPPPPPVPPHFNWKYIGTFGRPQSPIATFTREGDIVNVRVGGVIEGKFILRRIGIESVEIGFTGFPTDRTQRVPLSSQ